MRAAVAVVVLGLATANAAADKLEDDAEPMTLPELLQAAVRSAPQLENAAFSLAQSEAQAETARGPHDVTVSAVLDFTRALGVPPIPGLAGATNEVLSGSFSVKKLLPTNGTLELLALTNIVSNDPGGNITETFANNVKLRLTQPLLRGIGPASAYKTLNLARARRSAALVKHTADARKYTLDVVRAYWELAGSWRKLAVSRSSLELAKKQLALVEGAIRTGKFSTSELLPVQQAVLTRQQDIASAELEVIEASLDLRRLVGLPISPRTPPIKTIDIPEATPIPLEDEKLVTLAIQESADLRSAIEEEKGGRAALAGSIRDSRPKLDLRIDGGPNGADTTRFGMGGELLNDPTFRSGLGRIDEGGYSFAANLSFELPIGNHNANGTVRADRAVAAHLRFVVAATREDVASGMLKTLARARTHLANAQLGKRAIELAQQSVEAEQKKFEAGKSTSAEIVRRQDDLENARLREAVESTNYQVTIAAIEAATGEILARYGLKMLEKDRR